MRDRHGDEGFPDCRLHDLPLVGLLARENGEGGETLGHLRGYGINADHLHSACMRRRPPRRTNPGVILEFEFWRYRQRNA